MPCRFLCRHEETPLGLAGTGSSFCSYTNSFSWAGQIFGWKAQKWKHPELLSGRPAQCYLALTFHPEHTAWISSRQTTSTSHMRLHQSGSGPGCRLGMAPHQHKYPIWTIIKAESESEVSLSETWWQGEEKIALDNSITSLLGSSCLRSQKRSGWTIPFHFSNPPQICQLVHIPNFRAL